MLKDPEFFMSQALTEANKAAVLGEVPVGAVVVHRGEKIASAHNIKESTGQASRHAEIVALEIASSKLKNWRLNECELYVTLEPCIMCAGAIWQYRVAKVFYGTEDPKGGAITSLYEIGKDSRLNHRFESSGGILRDDCSKILIDFFKKKRSPKKED